MADMSVLITHCNCSDNLSCKESFTDDIPIDMVFDEQVTKALLSKDKIMKKGLNSVGFGLSPKISVSTKTNLCCYSVLFKALQVKSPKAVFQNLCIVLNLLKLYKSLKVMAGCRAQCEDFIGNIIKTYTSIFKDCLVIISCLTIFTRMKSISYLLMQCIL